MSDSPYRSRLVEYEPHIRALVRAIARDQGCVDDVVQECVTHIIVQEPRFDAGRGRIEGWFNTLSRHVALRFLQRRLQRRSKERDVDPETCPAPTAPPDADQIRWVLEQYARLEPPLRDALHLRYHRGLGTAQIGAELGISQQAASKRIQKALAVLQRRAHEHGLLSLLLPWHWPFLAETGVPVKVAATMLVAAAAAGTTSFFLPDPSIDLIAKTHDLPGTTVVASPELPLDAARNTLWCSSVQMAWNDMRELVGGPVQLDGDDLPESAALLNASTLTRDHVDAAALVTGAGRVDGDVVERVQTELEAKFGRGRDPVLDEVAERLAGSGGTLLYAFLHKDLPFEWVFKSYDDHPLLFRTAPDDAGTPVRCFGFREYEPTETMRAQAGQVRILSYASPADFVVRLSPTGGKDEMLLCRIPPGATLRATIDAAFARIAAGKATGLRYKDVLLLPKFDFELRHSYDELIGRELRNDGFDGQPVAAMFQDIRLRFDERGAVFQSRMMGAFGGEKPPDHEMRFDGPFLFLLKETAQAEPYFAMWVGNPELLLRPAPPPPPDEDSDR